MYVQFLTILSHTLVPTMPCILLIIYLSNRDTNQSQDQESLKQKKKKKKKRSYFHY